MRLKTGPVRMLFSTIFSLCLIAVLGLGVTSSQAAPILSGGIGGWVTNLTGTVAYKQGAINLTSDLKLDKNKTFPRAWIALETPIPLLPNIRADVLVMDYSGSNTVTNLGFGNYVFTGPISSKLKLNQYDLLVYYHIPLIQMATANTMDIRWGIDARYFDGYINITGTDPTYGIVVTEKKNLSFVLPMAYLGASISTPGLPLQFNAAARATTYEGSYFYDLEGSAKMTLVKIPPVGRIFVSGGYKWEQIKLKPGKPVDNFYTKTTVQGVFAEIGMSF